MSEEYYSRVPKGLTENLSFRKRVLAASVEDKGVQRDLWCMCARDILFYINVFCFTYDPRIRKIIPFITYPFQDEAILKMHGCLGKRDILSEKSRDQGLSWICMYLVEHGWHFSEMSSFLVVSRKEDLVDKTEDPDCLFWKIDCTLKHQPLWLKPNFNRQKLHFYNQDNGSTIDGASTTGHVGRGGRRTAVILDEFASFEVADGYRALASTQQVTKCRIFNSTPCGVGNAFYDTKVKSRNVIRFHWSQHPIQNRGLYTSNDGELVIQDQGFWDTATTAELEDIAPDVELRPVPQGSGRFDGFPVYPFVLDGKIRSPYYDNECERTAVATLIAQELDIDYVGSGDPVFNPDEIEMVRKRDVREPYLLGSIDVSSKASRPLFVECARGDLKLWIYPDAVGDVPRDRHYVIGADVSVGRSSSNSVLAVADRKTGECVGEYVTCRLGSYEFAEYAVALARLFHEAYLIWEANGPGEEFGQRVEQLGYGNIYYRTRDDKITKDQLDYAGWYTTRQNKKLLLIEYASAIVSGRYINRSEEALKECREYQYLAGGGVGHVRAETAIDPSGAKENHGDRVIAHALAWRGMQDVKQDRKVDPIVPPGSFAHRREMWKDQKSSKAWW